MSDTFYDGTIVVAQGVLKSLSHCLRKAEQQPNADTLLAARLHETMHPLPDQIRIASQGSADLANRLAGRERVAFEGDLTTFAKCHKRIAKAMQALDEADRNVVNQNGDKLEATNLGPAGMVDMSNFAFAYQTVLPNIFFHLVTAYGILRKEGVPLGKRDYYEGFFPRENDIKS